MNGGGGEVGVGIVYIDCLPLFLASGVVYVGKTSAIRERIFANACYTVADYHTRKAVATTERIFDYVCINIAKRQRLCSLKIVIPKAIPSLEDAELE